MQQREINSCASGRVGARKQMQHAKGTIAPRQAGGRFVDGEDPC